MKNFRWTNVYFGVFYSTNWLKIHAAALAYLPKKMRDESAHNDFYVYPLELKKNTSCWCFLFCLESEGFVLLCTELDGFSVLCSANNLQYT